MSAKSGSKPAGEDDAANSSPLSISEAEWQVMELLWKSSPLASQELVAVLKQSKGWARTTVVTLLQRLVKKGAVNAEGRGARFVYVPAVKRTDCVTAETTSLLDRLFGGALHPLVAHFAKHRQLSDKDVKELRALLDQIDPKKK